MAGRKRIIEIQRDSERKCRPFFGDFSPYWHWATRQKGSESRESVLGNPDAVAADDPTDTPEVDTREVMREVMRRVKLSKGEIKVLQQLSSGKTEEETADVLGCSRRQVRVLVSRAQKKCDKLFVAISANSSRIDDRGRVSENQS